MTDLIDGNDSIDLKEFNNSLKRLGIMMPPEGVVKYFQELDTGLYLGVLGVML